MIILGLLCYWSGGTIVYHSFRLWHIHAFSKRALRHSEQELRFATRKDRQVRMLKLF